MKKGKDDRIPFLTRFFRAIAGDLKVPELKIQDIKSLNCGEDKGN